MDRIVLLFLLLVSVFGNSQRITLTESAEISIITVAPGNNLVDTWGHSAIRVKDHDLLVDMAFNYGTYDFNTPNFYTKFAQGKLLYNLSIWPFQNFLSSYMRQNRTVKEQVLNLTLPEKQAYFDYLINNAKPENRAYLYDFLFDNCATKLREVSQDVFKANLAFNYDTAMQEGATFRELIHNYLDNHPWGAFGIDLALGSVIDRQAEPFEYTFLPDYIFESFKSASIISDGTQKSLVKTTATLFESEPKKTTSWFTPLLFFVIMFIFVGIITYRDFKSKSRTRLLDVILLFITGTIGVVVLLLWFATDHAATAKNFNSLWAFAPNVIVAFTAFKHKTPGWFKNYLFLLLLLLTLTVVLWLFGVQEFNSALLPVLLLLALRYVYLFKNLNH